MPESFARDLAIGGDEDGEKAQRMDASAPDAGHAGTPAGVVVDDQTDHIEEPASR